MMNLKTDCDVLWLLGPLQARREGLLREREATNLAAREPNELFIGWINEMCTLELRNTLLATKHIE